LPVRPAGPELVPSERLPGAEHAADAGVERALRGVPVVVERLLLLDLDSDARHAEIPVPERAQSGHEMVTNVAGPAGIANTGSSPKPPISSGFP
jgi:hypothetical protein